MGNNSSSVVHDRSQSEAAGSDSPTGHENAAKIEKPKSKEVIEIL